MRYVIVKIEYTDENFKRAATVDDIFLSCTLFGDRQMK